MESIIQFGIKFLFENLQEQEPTPERKKYEYYKNLVSKDKKPLAIVDLDLLNENLMEIAKRSKRNIRIASKSIRSTSILSHILQKCSKFIGIMCYSPEEALFLIEKGFDDLLLGYPAVNESILTDLAKKNNKVTYMVDLVQHLEILEKIGKNLDKKMRICIDIDMSYSLPGIHFGVFRSKCTSIYEISILLDFIKKSKYLKLVGVMGYESQIAGISDNNPNMNIFMKYIIGFLKKISIPSIFTFRKNVVKYIQGEGFPLEFVNGGGTGSIEETNNDEFVTEITVGSGFYSPHLFDYYNNFHYKPSAFYSLEVVRNPFNSIYTCYGGGYIASGASGLDKYPQIYLPSNASFRTEEGTGEVQTPIIFKDFKLKIGDPIFLRHAKAGELFEHFNEIHVISQNKVFKVKTYRGEGKCF